MKRIYVPLMHLNIDAGLYWLMSDCGALQYWITFDDLRAERFRRAEVTLKGC